MAEVGNAYLTIIPTMKGFAGKLQSELGGSLGSAGTTGGKTFSNSFGASAKSGMSGFGKVLGGTLLAGAGVAIAGIGAIIHTGFAETMDASKGTAQLAAGIKSTGNAAGVSVTGLNALASSIQGYSGQTDDSIVASEQLLLTFTNIKNKGPDKIFDRATAATADMAAKMGGDASGAAIQLGKALNDPVKGITALSRVGVSFTQAQKDSIAAMVKHGDTAGAQKIILKELETEFGGAAKAAGESMPGQLAKGKRAFEDLSQTLVTAAAPAIAAVSTKITTDVIPAMKSFADGFTNGTGAGGRFRDVLDQVGATVTAVGGFIKDHTTIVQTAAVVIGTITTAVVGYNIGVGVANVATKAWAVAQGIATAATWLWTAALNANPIGLVITAIGLLVGAIILIATRTTWFQTIWEYMSGALGKAWQWLWNSVLAPVIRFILNGFATITDGIASMLNILSNIPGFGWAKTAADKMAGAADKAHALANGIKDIPNKTVTVTFTSNYSLVQAQLLNLSNNANRLVAMSIGHNATGTDNWRGGPTWVGERGPEIVNLPRGAQVIPNHAIGSVTGSSGATSGDIKALGDRIGAELDRQARTIQAIKRQYA
jgi:Prophage tail length tape measure protein